MRHIDAVDRVTRHADGNFSIGYALGTLWITAEGFGPTSVTLQRNAVQGSGQRRSIPMYPPTVLAIEVSRSDDVPVREFRYGLARDLPDLHGPFPRHADGQRVEYELYHDCLLAPQARMLETIGLGISAGDLETRRRVRLELGTTNDVRAILEASQTRLAGRVLAEGEVPVADARVTAVSGEKRQAIYNERIAWRGSNSTRSAADGTYELTLPADVPSVNLVVEASDHPIHISERRNGHRVREGRIRHPPFALVPGRFRGE